MIIVSLQIQPGRSVRPIKALLAWDLDPGLEVYLPAEIEEILVRELPTWPALARRT
jgi:hypothetical protein